MRPEIGVNLLWIVPGVVGGSEEYAVRTLRAYLRRPDRPVEPVVYARRSLLDHHPELADECEVVTAPVPGGHRVLRVGVENTWLAAAARRRELAFVHHVGGRVPSVTAGVPALVTVHDLQPLDLGHHFSRVKRAYLGWAIPRSVRRARLVLTPSGHVADQLVARYGLAPDRVRAVSSGFDPPEDAPPVPPVVAEARGRGRQVIVYPAITHPHKDHLTLLGALRLLLDEERDVLAVLPGGPGRAEDQVTAAVADLGLADRVVRPGRIPRPELDGLIGAADLLVFPSTYEGFGIPVLEAMALGTPVVAAEATALIELVGDAGRLVPPGDAAGLARTVGELLDDELARRRLAEAGRTRARSFTWERSGEALAAAYSSALAR